MLNIPEKNHSRYSRKRAMTKNFDYDHISGWESSFAFILSAKELNEKKKCRFSLDLTTKPQRKMHADHVQAVSAKNSLKVFSEKNSPSPVRNKSYKIESIVDSFGKLNKANRNLPPLKLAICSNQYINAGKERTIEAFLNRSKVKVKTSKKIRNLIESPQKIINIINI
ncbi:hypothetical protein SteCoe_27047 [Stentor coeruleus]|uniref:Uncharacterized protein n=1 Tax=Stentor coeruleus TaxID=5963 RepID=A0A1R2BBW5_9CILI|nr:hypothetical protein SteCoe_27047 [Stentor coeruleus]